MRKCGTCGLTIEPPDEEIAPGDYWMIDAAAAHRCPECRQFPSVTPPDVWKP